MSEDQRWEVYQIDDDCAAGRFSYGNAIAACAALSARTLHRPAMTATVIAPDGEIVVRFAVAHIDPPIVCQRWHIGKIDVEDRSNESVDIGRVRGINDYW